MTDRLPRPAVPGAFVLLPALLLLATCSDPAPLFHEEGSPPRLSDWQLFTVSDSHLTPSPDSETFVPANPLFSDYAQKLRTLWLPPGATITLVDGEFYYPVGTVLSKTFYYPSTSTGTVRAVAPEAQDSIDLNNHRLLETRLLVRRESGWKAFPYVWNEDESEAFLRVAGAGVDLDIEGITGDRGGTQFTYFIPNENQCAGCHVTEHPAGDMHPLGAISRQLHYKRYQDNGLLELEISKLQRRGWLDEAALTEMVLETPNYLDSTDLQTRATEYLNINCGHCHNPEGPADTSNLILDGSHSSLTQMGLCKPPVAAGGGAGDLQFSIVPGRPDESILVYRMQSTAPDEMMPELGRTLVHTEGVQLIRDWITSLPGSCQ